MLDVHVLHRTSTDTLPSIFDNGLRYGEHGSHSQDERVRRTNEFLNAACPEDLKGQGVDRKDSLYCYLGVGENKVFDVASGRVVDLERWDVGAGNAKLGLLIDPDTTFVSDLDAYDALLERLDEQVSERALAGLAREYWHRLVCLSDVQAHYRLEDEALVAVSTSPPGLPRRLERVEVLVTADVAPQDIARI